MMELEYEIISFKNVYLSNKPTETRLVLPKPRILGGMGSDC